MKDAFAGNRFNYKTVAAAQTTAQICGEGGFINTLTIIPASSGGQGVSLLDGSTTIMTTPTHAGGTGARAYSMVLNIFSESSGGFKVTTGTSVSVIVSGNFSGTGSADF